MSFRDRPFNQRLALMGDAAERAFERMCEENDLAYIRTGLNRPPLNVRSLPLYERYRPDFMMNDRYVEAQGFGRDQVMKMKREKLSALEWWDHVMPAHLFMWDSKNKRWLFQPLSWLTGMIDSQACGLGHFPEGKSYFDLKAKDVEASLWTRMN